MGVGYVGLLLGYIDQSPVDIFVKLKMMKDTENERRELKSSL